MVFCLLVKKRKRRKKERKRNIKEICVIFSQRGFREPKN